MGVESTEDIQLIVARNIRGMRLSAPLIPGMYSQSCLAPLEMGIVPDISDRRPAAASVLCGHDSL